LLSADGNLGAVSGGLKLSAGGTLRYLTGFSTDRSVTLGAGGGAFDTNGNNATLAGAIGESSSGVGVLTKIGPGTLTLSAANTYSGATVVSAGTLALSGAGTLGSTSAMTLVGGGTLDLGGTMQTQNGGVLLNGGAIQNGTLTSTSFGAQAGTVSATLAGSGGLIKSGDGTVTLTGVNTYTGATTVNAGTLEVDGSIRAR